MLILAPFHRLKSRKRELDQLKIQKIGCQLAKISFFWSRAGYEGAKIIFWNIGKANKTSLEYDRSVLLLNLSNQIINRFSFLSKKYYPVMVEMLKIKNSKSFHKSIYFCLFYLSFWSQIIFHHQFLKSK